MSFGNLFGILARKKNQDIRVALDIGSESVKSIVFEKNGENLIIMKKLVTQYPLRDDPADRIAFIVSRIREDMFGIIKELHRVPDKVIIGISSDFFDNSIQTIKEPRPHKNRAVTEEEIAEIFKRGTDAIAAKLTDGVIVDSYPLRTVIDGYEIERITGDTVGATVELSVFMSVMKRSYWEQFRTIKGVLGGIPVKFMSNQFANAFSLPQVLKSDDAFFVDIGAKATELSYVKGKKIRSIGRFLYGGSNFTKIISETLSTGYSEAENIKRQYEDQVLPAQLVEKIRGAVLKGASEWSKVFMDALSTDTEFIVPKNVYAFGGGLGLAEVQDFLKSGHWAQGLSWQEKVDVNFLSAEKIAHNALEVTKLYGYNEVSFLSLIYYSYLLD